MPRGKRASASLSQRQGRTSRRNYQGARGEDIRGHGRDGHGPADVRPRRRAMGDNPIFVMPVFVVTHKAPDHQERRNDLLLHHGRDRERVEEGQSGRHAKDISVEGARVRVWSLRMSPPDQRRSATTSAVESGGVPPALLVTSVVRSAGRSGRCSQEATRPPSTG